MGHIDVAFQTYTFLWSVSLGAGFCVVYDFLRALHKLKVKGAVAVFVTDILFWLIAALVTYCFLILTSKGRIRLFVIIGIFLGFLIFRLVLSKIVLAVFVKILSIFEIILYTTSDFVGRILSTINKTFKNIANTIKKLLQPRVKVLYNYIKVSLLRKKGNRNGGRNQTEG